MINHLQVYLSCVFFILLQACNAPKEVDQPIGSPISIEKKVTNFDPYFVEASAITSPYGPTSITRNIMQDKKGNIWLATWEGIMKYDLKGSKTFTNFTNKDSLRRFHVFSVLEGKEDDLWFGTIGAGVYRYDGKTFTNFTSKDGLASDRQGCFYQDSAGKIWIGTMNGISIYDPTLKSDDKNQFELIDTYRGLSDNDINSIIEDKNGKFWIATRGKACIYDPAIGLGSFSAFEIFTNSEGKPFTNVRCIIRDRNDNMWLAGQEGLWKFDGNQFINYSRDFVGYVYEDKEGNIWTASDVSKAGRRATLSKYDKKTIDNPSVIPAIILQKKGMFFGIFEDDEEGIWMGTLDGVLRYDGKTFDFFRNPALNE